MKVQSCFAGAIVVLVLLGAHWARADQKFDLTVFARTGNTLTSEYNYFTVTDLNEAKVNHKMAMQMIYSRGAYAQAIPMFVQNQQIIKAAENSWFQTVLDNPNDRNRKEWELVRVMGDENRFLLGICYKFTNQSTLAAKQFLLVADSNLWKNPAQGPPGWQRLRKDARSEAKSLGY